MYNIHLPVGSQMGAAEYMADELAEQLIAQGHQATVHEQPEYDALPHSDAIWLVCTSTHGAGELPDNIRLFIDDLQQQKPDLSQLRYTVIGLGDTSYDTFCQAAKDIDALLGQLGAQKITDVLTIDVQSEQLPEEIALQWLPQWLKQL